MTYRGWRRNGTKYNAEKSEADGVKFDSKHEKERYLQLKLLERGNVISDLRLQVKYELIPNQYMTEERYGKNGKRLKDKQILLEQKCCYVADFVYTLNETGETVVEDAKSKATRTPEYTIKRKLMLWVHGIRIKEV